MMQGIDKVQNLSGRRALIRASLNVPIDEGVVRNDFRLRQTLQTIEFVRAKGARVIVCGHLSGERTVSMLPIFNALKDKLPVAFVRDVVGEETKRAVAELREGHVLLLENLRRSLGEETNDLSFAHSLAALGDLYVMDDFSVMHRKHASVVLVPGLLPAYAGHTVLREVEKLQVALRPKSPSLAILGGAKFHTKEALIRKCLPLYDRIFVGGALSNDLLKAKGYEVGRSLVSSSAEGSVSLRDIYTNQKVVLPTDVTVEGPLGRFVKASSEVLPTETILDAGPRSMEELAPYIKSAASILWNGPLGNYENGYIEQTEKLAELVSVSAATTVIGGGDSVAAIDKIKLDLSHIFVSTGGGAMIEFLANGTLPGLDALGYVAR